MGERVGDACVREWVSERMSERMGERVDAEPRIEAIDTEGNLAGGLPPTVGAHRNGCRLTALWSVILMAPMLELLLANRTAPTLARWKGLVKDVDLVMLSVTSKV